MSDLLDELLTGGPPIPFATGPAARGICFFIKKDGSISTRKYRQYLRSRARYEASFSAWKNYWVEIGRILRGDE